MSGNIGFILDIVIMILLAATVFYAARLSMVMKTFRDGKHDLQRLIRDLAQHIDHAEEAAQGLRYSAETSGKKLQDVVNEARFLSDELRFMNESGDNLAARLEKLAERNRELVDLLEGAGGIGKMKVSPKEPPPVAARPRPQTAEPIPEKPDRIEKSEEGAFPSFFIRDKDFEDVAESSPEESWADGDDDKTFRSQAERELYEALKKKPRKHAGSLT